MLPNLSYACTGSLAYPRSWIVPVLKLRQSMLSTMLELVHIDNLGPLPPDPSILVFKATEMGVARFAEFYY